CCSYTATAPCFGTVDRVLRSHLARGDFGRALRVATREVKTRHREAAGGAGSNDRAGAFADARRRFPAAGGDRGRDAGLPAPPQKGGRGNGGTNQAMGGRATALSTNRI